MKCLLQSHKDILEELGLKARFSSSIVLPALHNRVHPGSLASENYSIKYAMYNFDLNIKATGLKLEQTLLMGTQNSAYHTVWWESSYQLLASSFLRF